MNSRSIKPFRTYEEQIQILRDRNLIFQSIDEPVEWLKKVGYYRLSFYSYHWRDTESEDGRFLEGTQFSSVVSLYEFDRLLRNHVFAAMDTIEVAMRSRIGYALGELDETAHMELENFSNGFEHLKNLRSMLGRFTRAAERKDPVAKHHVDSYGSKLPIWVLVDFLDFSDLSRLYSYLKAPLQHQIAQDLNLDTAGHGRGRASTPHLAGWLHQLSIVRNYCAHHARLWDRSLKPQAVAHGIKDGFFEGFTNRTQSTNMYGAIMIISFLLNAIEGNNSWAMDLKDLIEVHAEPIPGVVPKMGFPADWKAKMPWV
ncbi:Abi family protein [Corynebacterium auriscanis]|nr:Abi family protein [Corynebacterium auriscanis]WJY71937.1 Abi-like protein [Corynebacterium auriscanis]